MFFNSKAQYTVGLINYDKPKVSEGYNLFYPLLQNDVYLVDNCGKLVNTWSDSGHTPGSSVYLLPNGNLLKTSSLGFGTMSGFTVFAGGAGDRLHLKDWDNNTLWTYTISDEFNRMHHDIVPLSNGNVLILAWERKLADEAIDAGRDPGTVTTGEIWTDYIVEIEPVGADGGNVVWRWDIWDHLVQDFDASKSNFGDISQLGKINLNYRPDESDWLHTNALSYNEELGHILLSVPGWDEIWMIDHNTTTEEAAGEAGDLIYRWGNKEAHGMGSDNSLLHFQHDPHWIEQGLDETDPDYGKIIVFNNKFAEDHSAVNIIAPVWNATNGEYEKNADGSYAPETYEQTITAPNPTDIFSELLSSVQKLPNGNFLICSGDERKVLEITAENEVVWEYVNPIALIGPIEQGTENPNPLQLFRFNRYAPDYAGLAGKDLTPGDFLESNANSELCDTETSVFDYFETSGIDIYPNPSAAIVNINGLVGNNTLSLYTINGKLIESVESNNAQYQFDISHLQSGYYLLSLNNKHYKKIIKE